MPVTDGIFILLCRSTPEGTAEKVQGESKSSVYRPSLSQKLEKGKPPERMGRKARGLRLASYDSPAANVSILPFNHMKRRKKNMAKNLKRGLSAFLAALMCTSTLGTAAFAEETANQTNFTPMRLENIVPGSDGYNYMIAQDLDNKIYYYASKKYKQFDKFLQSFVIFL